MEVRELCKELDLMNIIDNFPEGCSKASWKHRVNKAVNKAYEKELKNSIEQYSKLDELRDETTWERKDYFKKMTMAEARLKFSLRTKMFKCKFNYANDPKNKADNWKCDSCQRNIDSQSHVLWCPAYSRLREGKSMDNDKDIITYFKKVLNIRSKLKINK